MTKVPGILGHALGLGNACQQEQAGGDQQVAAYGLHVFPPMGPAHKQRNRKTQKCGCVIHIHTIHLQLSSVKPYKLLYLDNFRLCELTPAHAKIHECRSKIVLHVLSNECYIHHRGSSPQERRRCQVIRKITTYLRRSGHCSCSWLEDSNTSLPRPLIFIRIRQRREKHNGHLLHV